MQKLRHIVITGAVTSGGMDRRQLYGLLGDACRPYAMSITSPLDTLDFEGTSKHRFDRAMSSLRSADIVIAELSVPSTGQGIELQESYRLNVPVLGVAQEGSRVSGLVTGLPSLREIFYYSNEEDLLRTLHASLTRLCAP